MWPHRLQSDKLFQMQLDHFHKVLMHLMHSLVDLWWHIEGLSYEHTMLVHLVAVKVVERHYVLMIL